MGNQAREEEWQERKALGIKRGAGDVPDSVLGLDPDGGGASVLLRYCATESGFWVYKTLDQWKAENPGVVETLVANKNTPTKYEPFDDYHGKRNIYFLNDRFNWIVTQQDIVSLLPIIRTEQQVMDVKNNEVLARYVNFGAGNSVKNTVGPPGPLKFWMRNGNCSGGGRNESLMRQFKNQLRGVEE